MTAQSVFKAPPLSVGRYEITRRSGGLEAHKARDRETGVAVAVHLFPDDPKTSRLLPHLKAAFEAFARFDHPNVLRVLDFGREGAFGYLVTEWVEGTTLARLIESHSRLPEGNVIRVLAQVGQALDHTRAADAALCRICPSNVFVRTDGLTKVIPFRLPDGRAPETVVSSRLLKPEFAALANDLAIARPVPFSELVFSLGTTLHEALTGLAWVRPEVPSGRKRRPPARAVGLNERTERAIGRATDPEPARRPKTCAEFLKLLRSRSMTAGTPKPDVRGTMAAVENRRACVRYSLGVGTSCTINASLFEPPAATSDAGEVWPLVVQDVSSTGIGLLLARRCEPGTELAVEVGIGADGPPRRLAVKVVRVRKDNYGHWTHGCTFLEPLCQPELRALLGHIGRSEPV